MTVRLVALMSVVLLLSLGAFGLLINHYQDQVMAEVALTASEAGRAALRTLEFEDAGAATRIAGAVPAGMEWHAHPDQPNGPEADTATVDTHVSVKPLEGSPGVMRVVKRVESAGGVEGQPGQLTSHSMIMIQRLASDPTLEKIVVDCDTTAVEGTEGEAGEEAGQSPCVQMVQGGEELTGSFFISIEGVRAETDPAEGLVLTVPRFTQDVVLAAGGTIDLHAEADNIQFGSLDENHFEELRLPLGSGDYRELFESIRDRSLFVFLGVFIVGTALSAGVASRFTRPIRKLDAGIRKLSDGDLDVQVAAQGKDEVARLGRAFNDMTRSLRANRQRSAELVRREKLSALGRLAAGVAHDVRNPLHSIGLTLEHLRESCRPEEPGRAEEFDRSVEIIRGEVRRLDQTVGNFLRFARTDRRERKSIDLPELLNETARLVRKEAEWRKVEVALEIDEMTPPVLGDGESIRSSILNLVLNSFEAMPDGGTLTLALRHEEGEVVVEVADSGAGIDEEDREKVFDFAFTTREGGHGLGLAMVHQCVVEEHGGRIDLRSSPGEGTRVRLGLPAGNDAAGEDA